MQIEYLNKANRLTIRKTLSLHKASYFAIVYNFMRRNQLIKPALIILGAKNITKSGF